MAAVEIIEVKDKHDLLDFVRFPMDLYADCPYYVPPLIADELDTFSPSHNAAYETADGQPFLAKRDGRVVGRIAALISRTANEKFGLRNVRFGWFDSVDDYGVAAALFQAAEAWGRARGMETITGPQGFNQFGKAGMLIEGYEQLATMATYYNYPYYSGFVERYGFAKEVDYVEYRVTDLSTNAYPPRLFELAEKLKVRKQFRVLPFPRRRDLLARTDDIMALLQETYVELYGVTAYTERQRQYYARKFFPFLHKDLVKVVENRHGELIGFCIAMPSLSSALRKARGRLFPFGWFHLLRAARGHTPTVDFCLTGVRKRYRGRGIDLIMGTEIYKSIRDLGFEQAESNPELENNLQVQGEWRHIKHVLHKRRRVYKKVISG